MMKVPKAKPAKDFNRRNLPHLQAEGRQIFLTFATYRRWLLPESARGLVLKHCLHDNGTKLQVHGLVVMPDHVHMIFTPLNDSEGSTIVWPKSCTVSKEPPLKASIKPSTGAAMSGKTSPSIIFCDLRKALEARSNISAKIRCERA